MGMRVTVRYFAAAKAAAGRAEDVVDASTLAEALASVPQNAKLSGVLAVCSFLVDGAPVGTRPHADVALAAGSVVECLPPFAGG